MSIWESSIFKRIYKKWQKRKQRGKFDGNVLETALKEYYQTVESVEMIKGKPYTPQQTPKIVSEDTKLSEEQPPAPSIEEDEIVHIGGMAIRESKYRELMSIQKSAGVAKTLSPDQKMFLYLKSLFRGDRT